MKTEWNESIPTEGDSVGNGPAQSDAGNGMHDKWKIFVTWILRIVVGAVFVFSGFVKAIDPWGTIYKIDDYLNALSIEVWPNLVLVGGFGLNAVEFLCGVFLLLGCFRMSSAILAAIIMTVMLPLSIWIAVSEPVADCGCFGDAYVISNWATFWKNVALSVSVGWLVLYNNKIHWIVTPALQWIAFLVSGLFIVTVELFGYVSQPLLDFRPYRVGETLVESSDTSTENPEFVFVYERDGERMEISENDEVPDESSGWKFVERRELGQAQSLANDDTGKNLQIWSRDGSDNETYDAVLSEGKELIVMMPDLDEVSPATTWKLNSLNEWSLMHDVEMIAVVSGSQNEISEWEDLSMASYPIYTADDTQIKSVVRGNPGVVYLVDGVIKWKSTLTAINIDDFMSPETSGDAESFAVDNPRILRNLGYVYLSVLAVLIILSFTPYMKRMWR